MTYFVDTYARAQEIAHRLMWAEGFETVEIELPSSNNEGYLVYGVND